MNTFRQPVAYTQIAFHAKVRLEPVKIRPEHGILAALARSQPSYFSPRADTSTEKRSPTFQSGSSRRGGERSGSGGVS